MENNQTAVRWLVEQLKLHETGEAEWMSKSSTINRALRMEKEQIELPDYDKVTRFEVIDHTSSKEGRIFVKYSVMVDVSIQDNGRTMKVFLKDKNEA